MDNTVKTNQRCVKTFEESEICKRTQKAIINKDYVDFDKCIKNKSFKINERFDTSYTYRENYLNYALLFQNYYAVNKLLKFKKLMLYKYDKDRIIETLIATKNYKLCNIWRQ